MFQRKGGKGRCSNLSPSQRRFMDEERVVGWSCVEPVEGFLMCSIAEEPSRDVWKAELGKVLGRSIKQSPTRMV